MIKCLIQYLDYESQKHFKNKKFLKCKDCTLYKNKKCEGMTGAMIKRVKQAAHQIWNDDVCDIWEDKDKQSIFDFLEVEGYEEIEGVDSEDTVDEFSILNSYLKSNLITEDSHNWFHTLITSCGRFIFESEDGGYYSICWKKNSIDWDKIGEILDEEDYSSC